MKIPSMAEILTLLFFAFSFSILQLQPSLISFATQNYNNNSIISLPLLPFFLLPVLTFISAIVLLLLHVAMPQSSYTKHLAKLTRALTFSNVLITVVLMSVPLLSATGVRPESIIEVAVIMATATLIAHTSFARSSFSYVHLTSGFIPVFFALCISTATLFLVGQSQTATVSYHDNRTNPFSNKVIHLLLFCNFTLAILLLFLRASTGSGGPPPRRISALMVERIAKTAVATSIIITLIAAYEIVALQVGMKSLFV